MMHHVLTVEDIVYPLLAIGVIIGFGAFLMFLVWLFNPFRSGH